MNRELANQLLDKARDGTRFTFEEISAALYATGDLYDPMRGERMEEALQEENSGVRKDQSSKLVVSSEKRHSQNSWTGWSRYLDCRNEQK